MNLDELFNQYYIVQDKDEFRWLTDEIIKINPRTIIELGVENGGTLKCWEQILPAGGVLIGVDTKDQVQWKYRESDRNITLIQGHTLADDTIQKVRESLNGNKADFMFIDASDGHNPDVCEREFNTYLPFVREHGLIGFHDSMDVKGFLDKLDQSKLQINRNRIGTALYRL